MQEEIKQTSGKSTEIQEVTQFPTQKQYLAGRWFLVEKSYFHGKGANVRWELYII